MAHGHFLISEVTDLVVSADLHCNVFHCNAMCRHIICLSYVRYMFFICLSSQNEPDVISMPEAKQQTPGGAMTPSDIKGH